MPNPFIEGVNSLLPEPHASLLLGILFGVKATMPKGFYDSLVATGTLHIIALSGMNITILAGIVSRLTTVFGKRTSVIFSLITVFVFILFVGPSPSVVRAGIMGSLGLLSIVLGRQTLAVFNLFITALLMLLFNHELISSISFQLSFLSTLGIIIFNKGKEGVIAGKENGVINMIKVDLRLTLSAQLFTMPVILYNFGRLSLVAPLANVTISWVIPPIMILGFLLSLFSITIKPLAIVLSWITWLPLEYLIKVIEILSKVPFASVQF